MQHQRERAVSLSHSPSPAVRRLFAIHSDDHIFDILRAKLTDYTDFHVALYLKQKEYRALHNDAETMRDIFASGIAQTCGTIAAAILFAILLGPPPLHASSLS